jgi:glutamate-1-semialdehyde aminotransferase
MTIHKSIEAYKRAKNAIAGGVNSPVRAYSNVPHFIQGEKDQKSGISMEMNTLILFPHMVP